MKKGTIILSVFIALLLFFGYYCQKSTTPCKITKTYFEDSGYDELTISFKSSQDIDSVKVLGLEFCSGCPGTEKDGKASFTIPQEDITMTSQKISSEDGHIVEMVLTTNPYEYPWCEMEPTIRIPVSVSSKGKIKKVTLSCPVADLHQKVE